MAPKKITLFFAELGKMMNLIRSISAELNEEIKLDRSTKASLNTSWYTKDYSIPGLQANLQKLENEIAYFFTDNGCRKTVEDRFNNQMLRQKIIENFMVLTNEYFTIKTDYFGKINHQQYNNVNATSEIYKLKALPFSILN